MTRTTLLSCMLLVIMTLTPSGNASGQDDGPRTIFSMDDALSLSIPAHMDTMELHEDAVLQMGDYDNEVYVIVLNDWKEDLEGWNIGKHSYITLGNLLRSISAPIVQGPEKSVIDDLDVIQYTIEGAVDGKKIVYLHTTIETPSVFSQIVAWSLRSRYDENRMEMEEIVRSFQTTDME